MGDSVVLNARIGPLARYVAEPVRGIVPLVVTFTEASVGEINAWLWDLGDGTTSTLPNLTHTYASPGVYTVTLTVSGPSGNDTTIRQALIEVKPHKIFLPLILRSFP
jgi:PKD repeat protein